MILLELIFSAVIVGLLYWGGLLLIVKILNKFFPILWLPNNTHRWWWVGLLGTIIFMAFGSFLFGVVLPYFDLI